MSDYTTSAGEWFDVLDNDRIDEQYDRAELLGLDDTPRLTRPEQAGIPPISDDDAPAWVDMPWLEDDYGREHW